MTKVKVGIIGGTGLDNPDIIENRKERIISTPFGSSEIVEGTINGVDCVLVARHGKSHSLSPSNVNFRANIHALKILEVTHVIATTAMGSLKAEIKPGDIAVLDDFVDRTKTRVCTFYDGSEISGVGVCHIPMSPAFDERTRQVIIDTAKELGIAVHPKGVAVTIEGPRFSTKAESHLFRSWNCDLVGMTLVPEVILAKEAGLLYASIAMATDYDSWRECETGVCVEEVMATFKKNVAKVTQLVLTVVPRIAKMDWTDTITDLKNLVNGSIMLPNQYNK